MLLKQKILKRLPFPLSREVAIIVANWNIWICYAIEFTVDKIEKKTSILFLRISFSCFVPMFSSSCEINKRCCNNELRLHVHTCAYTTVHALLYVYTSRISPVRAQVTAIAFNWSVIEQTNCVDTDERTEEHTDRHLKLPRIQQTVPNSRTNRDRKKYN